MKIKEGFKLRTVCGNSIVVAVGKASLHFNGLITLNSTGEFIWSRLEQGSDEQKLARELAEEYSIPAEQALADVREFIVKLKGADLLEG